MSITNTPPAGPPPVPKPPRVAPRIVAAPKIGQVYYCDFWRDAQLPEFWKTRPVIIISYKNTLSGPCLVIPTTTDDQGSSPWAYAFDDLIGDGFKSWAVCNHLYTIAPSRLSQIQGKIYRLTAAQLAAVLSKIDAWIPKPLPAKPHGSP